MTNKILHVSHTDVRSDSRIIKEINCLSEAGYNVEVIGVDFDEGGKTASINNRVDLTVLNVMSNRLRNFKYFPNVLVYALIVLELTFRILFLIISRRPHVIHCHDTLVLPGCVLSKFFTNSKLIYDAHELESNKNGTSKTGGYLTFFVEKILWNKIDAIISVSDSIVDWYFNNIGKLKHSAVVLNSPVLGELTTSLRKSKSDYLRHYFNVPFDSKIFIYVGILGQGRLIEDLVDVFKNEVFNSHLVFIGYGQLESYLRDEALYCSRIHVHEAVPHDQLVSVIASADVGLCLIPSVSLSDYYCLPNKLFEYIFSGLPVISSKLPEMAALVEGRGLGITTDLEKDSIINAVLQFENEKVNVDFKFDHIEDLSWKAQTDKLLDLYRNVCK